jgi:hypothetical protein
MPSDQSRTGANGQNTINASDRSLTDTNGQSRTDANGQNTINANAARSASRGLSGLGRLAAWCYDHRRRVLAGWVLAVVVIAGLAQWAGSRLDNDFSLASSPSQQAQNLLASRFPAQKGDSADVVLRSPRPLVRRSSRWSPPRPGPAR